MEKAMDWEQKSLINELTKGRELAKQLRNYHLNPSSSHQTSQFLVEKILGSYEKALSMLNWGSAFVGETKPTISILESPHSFANGSPTSQGSDLEYCKDQCQKVVYKKRKTMPLWTEQVKVCSGTGLEGPLDDGYCWRKYGQKDILGSSFPRGYYRCTHRHAQGCLATKQVQRSDHDPTIFEVTYRGRHSCNQASNLVMPSSTTSMINIVSKENKDEGKPKQSQDVLLNFGAELKVETQDLGTTEESFPSFSFPYASIESHNMENNHIFVENSFMESFSPTFISPATSESNYFSVSPCLTGYGLGQNVQTPESDLTEIISAMTSVTNLPIEDFDFSSLDKVDFETNFPFDSNPEFFC